MIQNFWTGMAGHSVDPDQTAHDWLAVLRLFNTIMVISSMVS